MLSPPTWTREELDAARLRAIENFREERLKEPLEAYLEAFDKYQGIVEDLLETTIDLKQLDNNALAILTDKKLLEAFRYLAGPPISADDIATLAEAVLKPKKLTRDPEMVKRLVDVVRTGLDRRRFPWVVENREPTEAEKNGAVLASAALMATQRVGTDRRSLVKKEQEQRVEEAILGVSFTKVRARKVPTLADAPKTGEFCRESMFGKRKADFLIGLWDRRIMALECKVSNSEVNSIKRLNNDAAVKARIWRDDFGTLNVAPAAVMSGVYGLDNLEDAQDRGLTLFWAHDLQALLDWIEKTKADVK